MQISSSTPADVSSDYQVAIQKKSLDALQIQGAQVTQMIASAGSVNTPSQGKFIDAHV